MAKGTSPAPQYYRPLTAVILTIVAFFGSQVVGALVFGTVLLLLPGFQGLSGAEIEAKITANHWLFLTFMGLLEGMAVAVIWMAIKRRTISLAHLGLGAFRWSYIWKAVLGYGAVLGLNVVVFSGISMVFPHIDLSQKQDLGVDVAATGGALIPIFIALVLLPPIVEEFVMRGFLFTNLRGRLSFMWSAVVVSLLFGLAHITQTAEGLFWSGAVSFFVLSMVLCYLREKTGSLWASIGVHMLQNGLAFAFLYIWKVA